MPPKRKVEKEKSKTQDTPPCLTADEKCFCNLFVHGGLHFAGQRTKCYEEVFGTEEKNTSSVSRKLLHQPHILEYIKELTGPVHVETEALAIKLQVTETLKSVMEETSTAQFDDKFGTDLSPAPLRAVAVNAAKALMELYPIKHAQEARLKIEGAGNGGITFNVIVPDLRPIRDEEV